MRKPWTMDEIRQLEELFPLYTDHQIAEKLGRTTASVSNQARKMGILRHKKWTRDMETELLRLRARGCKYSVISAQLGKSIESCELRHKTLMNAAK